jgi:hypothetical protein
MADRPPGYLTPTLERWRARTDGPLLVLAIGTLPFLLLDVGRGDLPRQDQVSIDTVNRLVLVAFAVDYVVELGLASDRGQYARREWTPLVIVVSQALAVLPGLGPLGALRVLRGARGARGTQRARSQRSTGRGSRRLVASRTRVRTPQSADRGRCASRSVAPEAAICSGIGTG